jgi:hypothetical protein
MTRYKGQRLRKSKMDDFSEHNARISSNQEVFQQHLTPNISKVNEEFNSLEKYLNIKPELHTQR